MKQILIKKDLNLCNFFDLMKAFYEKIGIRGPMLKFCRERHKQLLFT